MFVVGSRGFGLKLHDNVAVWKTSCAVQLAAQLAVRRGRVPAQREHGGGRADAQALQEAQGGAPRGGLFEPFSLISARSGSPLTLVRPWAPSRILGAVCIRRSVGWDLTAARVYKIRGFQGKRRCNMLWTIFVVLGPSSARVRRL